MSLWVVVGGQFGSEGKGKVSAFITRQEDIDICVRCGGPNSGHSFVDDRGQTIVLRQLPTGFINPKTRLLIPAGALIDPTVLKQEIDFLSLPLDRVGIDSKCFIIEERDREQEQSLGLRERLSSTLCGVGAAQARRVLRGQDARLARDAVVDYPWMAAYLTDVSCELNTALDSGKSALIEGTQGFGLSLYHSEFYPRTTSRDTTAAGFLSEVGVSPLRVTEVVVVFRTFPIRVAGKQAGPLKDEITWEELQRESGYPHSIEEHTTVTKKVRRVGRFDWKLALRAVQLNKPTHLAINCLDYLDFSNTQAVRKDSLSQRAKEFISELEQRTSTPVDFMGVGPRLGEIITGSDDAAFCFGEASTPLRRLVGRAAG
jgi:adenylosuccinate synthase